MRHKWTSSISSQGKYNSLIYGAERLSISSSTALDWTKLEPHLERRDLNANRIMGKRYLMKLDIRQLSLSQLHKGEIFCYYS
jgi:hypothetical protein